MKYRDAIAIALLVALAFSSYGLGRLGQGVVREYAKLHQMLDVMDHSRQQKIS
jgi:hypothetical protein